MGHFVDRIRDELRIPQIDSALCVYSLAECATCQRCVEACPTKAWILDDDALKLNVDLCNGCGLCLPACPEGALSQDRQLSIRSAECGKALFIHCEKSQYSESLANNGESLLPCIHAIGLRDLVQYSQLAVSTIVTTTGDCQSCHRHAAPCLSDNVRDFNLFLKANSLPELSLYILDTKAFQTHWETSQPFVATGPVVSRRFFLRQTVNTALSQAIEPPSITESGPLDPPLKALQHSITGELFPFVPSFDSARCNGCDACIQLCPHQALQFKSDKAQTQYEIDATNCTGCHLCIDVCDQDAIELNSWQMLEQTVIPLHNASCPRCGVNFHLPYTNPKQDRTLCRICMQTDHNQRLFQVLD